MRIAVVEPEARGGLLHHALMLSRTLARQEGVEVTLVTARCAVIPGPVREELAASGVGVEPLLRLWDPKPGTARTDRSTGGATAEGEPSVGGPSTSGALSPARRLARGLIWYREWLRLALRLRRLRPDFVQLGDVRFAGDLAPILLLRAMGLRLTDVCHNVEPFAGGGRSAGGFGRRGLARALERRVYRRIYRCFELVFVHHRVNRERFLRLYDLPPARVRAVPLGNGRIFAELRRPDGPTAADLRRRLGLAEGAPVVLLFGTLSRYKGADLLVEAFAAASGKHPDARLVLAGFALPDLDPGALRARAEELGVGDAVVVVPEYLPEEEVAAWMELASVAVFPYRDVHQSAALQVALTLGVPTVASRVGAIPEVVRHQETGLSVPPGDPEALAAALGRLLGDPRRASVLGAAAARDQRARFCWDRVAGRMAEAYRQLDAASGAAVLGRRRVEGRP